MSLPEGAKPGPLYQLLRQKNSDDDYTFEVQFLDPGIQVFSFTFG